MNVIYVDDEKLQLTNFSLTVAEFSQIERLNIFNSSEEALKWVQQNEVDIAFLDIEMPIISGIELAKRLKAIDENICIVFVTAYEQYALQAFGVDAIGYLLKPYCSEDIEKQLKKAYYLRQMPKAKIQIYTMPDLSVVVNGKHIMIGHNKQEELLALLVDRGKVGLTKSEAIESLWQNYYSDNIYWTTMSRLKKLLEENGISNLIITKGQTKYINTEIVDCDLYLMQNGDKEAINNYQGEYLSKYFYRYQWVQSTKAQLDEIKGL